jgi:ADP-heptose:LPS heptosyltransferase
MSKLKLEPVTLIAVAGSKQAETIAAMYKSMAQIDFAACKLITNIDIEASGIEVVNVGGLDSWDAYNRFVVKELYKHFDTSFCLICQWDGYVLNADCWTPEFYKYDYIGAKWLDLGKPYNCGNGGFSFRSKRLQYLLGTDEQIITTTPEDTAICKVYGQYLVDHYDIKFCTEEIADKFSYELNPPLHPTFGFHAFHHPPYQDVVVIKRDFGMGDVITAEPLMEYYFRKGYRVVLDTAPDNYLLFANHHFPVEHISHLHPDIKRKTIDLTMAYEVKPKQLRLHSYYDFAEVPHEERIIRNPRLRLNLELDSRTKLFQKYIVVHNDIRNEAYRNVYGVDWPSVVRLFNESGYTVIQAGAGEQERIEGAIRMNTPTTPFLMWLIAGADGFIGVDSGLSHIASAFGIPSIVFYGSVDPHLLYPEHPLNKVYITQSVCEKPFCWSDSIGQTGTPCYIDTTNPPCTKYDTRKVWEAINQLFE